MTFYSRINNCLSMKWASPYLWSILCDILYWIETNADKRPEGVISLDHEKILEKFEMWYYSKSIYSLPKHMQHREICNWFAIPEAWKMAISHRYYPYNPSLDSEK